MIWLAGYVARGKPMDWLVRAVTFSPVSHVELTDGETWLSASLRDGGVRMKRMRPKPGHWLLEPLPDGKGRDAWDFMARQIGARYDLRGAIIGPVLGLDVGVSDAWFCSEIIAAALGWDDPHTVAPGAFFSASALFGRRDLLSRKVNE